MTRRRAWFVVAAVVGAALIGCGGGDEAGEQVEQGRPAAPGQEKVRLSWVRSAGKPRYQRTGAILYCTDTASSARREAVKRFNAKYRPAAPVRLRAIRGDTWSQYDKFVALRDECDVFDADVIATGELASRRLVYDMSPYVERRRDKFIGNAVRTACYGAKYWGVPHSTNVGLIFFPTDREPPTSWQEAYQGIVFQAADEALTVNFLELATAAGGRVLTRNGRASVLDRSAADRAPNLRALELMVGAEDNARAIAQDDETDTVRSFRRGDATYMRNWPVMYQRKYWDGSGPSLSRRQVRVAPLPLFEEAGVAGVLGGANLVISSISDNPKSALALVDFLTTDAEQKRGLEQFEAPVIDAAYTHPPRSLQNDLGDYWRAFVRDLRRAVKQATPRPVIPGYRGVSAAIATNVRRALDGEATPEEALADAHDTIDEIVSKAPVVATCTG